MKKKNITHKLLLLALPVLLLCAACKNPKIEYGDFTITDESIQVETYKAVISGSYEFIGTVTNITVNVGEEETLSDATSHPMQLGDKSFETTIDNLSPNTTYYYNYTIEYGAPEKLIAQGGNFKTGSDIPTVRTLSVSVVDRTTLYVKGVVDTDGGAGITERGVCWNKSGDPHIGDGFVKHDTNALGEYTCPIRNLEFNTTYFVRAYAKNASGITYATEVLQCTTNDMVHPVVGTHPVSNITTVSAICGGSISDEGSSPIIERGICWSTNPNPDLDDLHQSSNSNENDYSITLSDLTPDTRYYVKAYATNSEGTGYGDEKEFRTDALPPEPEVYNISASWTPTDGGHVEGGGEYEENTTCTLKAIANDNYEFEHWLENGLVVHEEAVYSFTVNASRTLKAVFTLKSYKVTVVVNPSNGGTVTGDGDYDYGTSCHLNAVAAQGFDFQNWTNSSGQVLSSNTSYSITVTEDITIEANFEELPTLPDGIIDGLFSVGPSPSEKVYFSRGNLQYHAYNNKWRFAEAQWNHIGQDNANISPNYNGWIDLFGWGTGDEPTSTQSHDQFHEWGDNPISNGGNETGLWRTLTRNEWDYVFNTRQTNTNLETDNARYAKALVNNVKGIILFPDDYQHPSGITIPKNINNPSVDFAAANNNYTQSQWQSMQTNGCVFLPITGQRIGVIISDLEKGHYWSSTKSGSNPSCILFDASSVNTSIGASSSFGYSVRLVHPGR